MLLMFLITIIVCCVWFWRPGLWFDTPNQGHRLGGDVIQTYPENTLEVFRLAIEQLESNDQFAYTECDLRETKDNQIVLFHDWDLARLVPDTDANRQALGVEAIDESVLLKDLTIQQIQGLRLKNGCKVPTLEQFFACAKELRPEKPILLELKLLQTEEACSRVIELAQQFRDESGLEVHFLSFIRNINRSHPHPRKWLNEFRQAGFRVYQAYRPKTPSFDLCETW